MHCNCVEESRSGCLRESFQSNWSKQYPSLQVQPYLLLDVSHVYSGLWRENVRFSWAAIKSMFSIIRTTRRSNALPLTLETGERGVAVATSEAMAAVPVDVFGMVELALLEL